MESTIRACHGCGDPMPLGHRERNARKWCSESCRIKAHRRANPDYVARGRAAAAERAAQLPPASHDLTCRVCGGVFASARRGRFYCSPTCAYRAHRSTRKSRIRAGSAERYSFVSVAERDGWTCGLCAGLVVRSIKYPDPSSGSIDHIVPLALGGGDSFENVQLAHLGCNWSKGAQV